MSEKVRRQKDIVKNAATSYLEATQTYQDYLDGASAVTITYYQIADEASRTDTSLDDTHEVVGSQSSIFYYRIKNVKVYGTSPLDIITQLTQRSVESFITGDFVMTPELTIYPRPGEFFAFADDVSPELSEHLFQITDVQFDKATSSKYFKCSYKLYPNNTDKIYAQVIKNFVYDPSNKTGNKDGVGDSVLITEEAAAKKEQLESLIDGLIDKYSELFYNAAMDTFTYQKVLDKAGTQFEYYWSPYICHFIYKNKIMEKTKQDFLTEIFVQDVNENTNPAIYSEKGYRKSIYYAVEVDDCEIMDPIKSSFMGISAYDLNKPLNLPFFSAAEKYKLVDLYHDYNPAFWFGAFNWVYGNEDHILFNEKEYISNGEIQNIIIDIIHSSNNDIVYDDNDDLIIPDNLQNKILDKVYYHTPDVNDISAIDNMVYLDLAGNAMPSNIVSLMTTANIPEDQMDYLVLFIRKYFSHSISLTDAEIKKINEYYYDNTMRTYLLLPIIIYILQNYEGEPNE